MTVTTIEFKEMQTKELRNKTVNLDELTDFGRFLLNGDTIARFDGQFVGLYLDGNKYYEYGFFYDKETDTYELEG